MYAVIKTGGKQHRVEPGEVLKLEKLSVEAGKTVDYDEVMMIDGHAIDGRDECTVYGPSHARDNCALGWCREPLDIRS